MRRCGSATSGSAMPPLGKAAGCLRPICEVALVRATNAALGHRNRKADSSDDEEEVLHPSSLLGYAGGAPLAELNDAPADGSIAGGGASISPRAANNMARCLLCLTRSDCHVAACAAGPPALIGRQVTDAEAVSHQRPAGPHPCGCVAREFLPVRQADDPLSRLLWQCALFGAESQCGTCFKVHAPSLPVLAI
jgi:hypothetical protein